MTAARLFVSPRCLDQRHEDCSDCQCRCHIVKQVMATAVRRGERAPRPIPPPKTRDLLAHLRSHMSLEQAATATALVIDLGWRPTVGGDL